MYENIDVKKMRREVEVEVKKWEHLEEGAWVEDQWRYMFQTSSFIDWDRRRRIGIEVRYIKLACRENKERNSSKNIVEISDWRSKICGKGEMF